jgi:hypothetical protein
MAAVSDIYPPRHPPKVPTFDTERIPGIDHRRTGLLATPTQPHFFHNNKSNDKETTKMPRRSQAANTDGAMKKSQKGPVTRDEAGQILLEAIKNSTTRMDQIVQRRIGINDEPPRKLK